MSGDDDDAWRDSVPTDEEEESEVVPSKPSLRIVTADDRRPDVILTPDVHLTTEAILNGLKADPELYQRGGSLSHVIRAEREEPGIEPGSPVVRAAPLSWLVDRTSAHVRCVRWNGKFKRYDATSPPSARVLAVKERGAWPGIRELRGVIEAPAMRPDGSVIQAAGYDAATRYLFEPNAKFRPVLDAPTQAQACRALACLADPFVDFPYVAESHRYAVLAAILTLLARPAIQGSVPCWVLDASSPRSGKSKQVDMIHLITTGRPASRMTYPEIDEELEKVLAGYALRGASSVNFDNVARKFGGAALDKVITAIDTVDLRMLGSSDLVTLPWRAAVFASGNNVECRGDMLPRVLAPRIESNLDNPETRTGFKHEDVLGFVRANRSTLVAAALTVLRGYVVAGRPDMGLPKWGGFEAWARLIPHAIVWAGGEDPMGARRGLEGDDDPERLAAAQIVKGWETLCRNAGRVDGLTIKEAMAILYPERSRHEEHEPDGYDDLREAIEALARSRPGLPPGSRQVAEAVRRLKARPIAGRKLLSEKTREGVQRWRVVRTSA